MDVALGLAMLALLAGLGVWHLRSVRHATRLRFEHERLVEELRKQNADAERARLSAEEASRSKSRFFAAANHDLRQPLHSLGLFATALRNQVSDIRAVHLADQILQCSESLEELFDNLLDISKLDAGQIEVRREVFLASALLERIRNSFAQSAEDKQLSLRIRPSTLHLHTDGTLVLRIVSNLVANAIRYTARGGVLIVCRRRKQEAWIEVWDTGCGIPVDQQERVFEEFYQLQNPERDRKHGLGLGLATVRRLADLLDYRVELRSRVGRGTRFRVRVPLADASRPTGDATLEQQVPNLIGGKTILVIDDEASVRLGMQSLLESWGCRCIIAADATEALHLSKGQAPDFILADLRLRADASGLDAIRSLRAALGRTIPAVLISGDTAPEQLRKVSAAGFTLMHKPLKAVRLRALLNHEFARREDLRKAL
jgi:two-component system, sensor histidine kinase